MARLLGKVVPWVSRMARLKGEVLPWVRCIARLGCKVLPWVGRMARLEGGLARAPLGRFHASSWGSVYLDCP